MAMKCPVVCWNQPSLYLKYRGMVVKPKSAILPGFFFTCVQTQTHFLHVCGFYIFNPGGFLHVKKRRQPVVVKGEILFTHFEVINSDLTVKCCDSWKSQRGGLLVALPSAFVRDLERRDSPSRLC